MKIILEIINCTYFVGMGWLIMCEYVDKYINHIGNYVPTEQNKDDYFITKWKINQMPHHQ